MGTVIGTGTTEAKGTSDCTVPSNSSITLVSRGCGLRERSPGISDHESQDKVPLTRLAENQSSGFPSQALHGSQSTTLRALLQVPDSVRDLGCRREVAFTCSD